MKNYDNILLSTKKYRNQRDFWIDQLKSIVSEPLLQKGLYEINDEVSESPGIREFELVLKPEIAQQLLHLSKNSDLTLFVLLLSLFMGYLYRYTGKDELILAVPIYKKDPRTSLINDTIVIKQILDSKITFKSLLLNTKQFFLKAIENQEYPFEKLREELEFISGQSYDFLTDLLFASEDIHHIDHIKSISNRLLVYYSKKDKKIIFKFRFKGDYFKPIEIKLLITYFNHLLEMVLADLSIKMQDIEMLSDEEKRQLIFEFNHKKANFSQYQTVYHFIENHAQQIPDHIAASFNDRQISYLDLNNRANHLTFILWQQGLQEEQPVGILLERGFLMLESILAIWKSGGAYIPIDIHYPSQRIKDILSQANAFYVITSREQIKLNLEEFFNGRIIHWESSEGEDNQQLKGNTLQFKRNLNFKFRMSQLAYIIYTSGSTGKPKGVMVEHLGMMNHMHAKINDLQMNHNRIVAQNSSHTFDISVWQFFASLIVGGRIVVYSNDIIMEPSNFIFRLIQNNVSILEVVPSYLSVLLDIFENNPSISIAERLQYIIVTGETLKPTLVNRWFKRFPSIKMVNAYGPTEASDDITHYYLDKMPTSESIPIGSPIQNLNIHIFNKSKGLCPVGMKGEICVSGIGVGRGYLNKVEETSQVFFIDPHVKAKNIRLYRTGDIGCWLPDGTIRFYGRKDHQVKIRGFRIECDEIIAVCESHPDINESVVIDQEDEKGNKFLSAYIVPIDSNKDMDLEKIIAFLIKRLPDYMIPAHIQQIKQIPLTPNGKIDRKALLELDLKDESIPFISEKSIEQLDISLRAQKRADGLFYFSELKQTQSFDNDITKSKGEKNRTGFNCCIIGETTLPIKCAEILLRKKYQICGVISKEPQVREWARMNHIDCIPFKKELISLFFKQKPFDFLFSINNTYILPEQILKLPKKSTYNYHNAPLPRYAGCNAPYWAILNQETIHGVTWHRVDTGIDTGEIVKQIEVDISPSETGFSLNLKCYHMGIEGFEELIRIIENGKEIGGKQNNKQRTYFGKYKRPDNACLISFLWDAEKIDAYIRALNFGEFENPLGLPKICIKNKFFILKKISITRQKTQLPPGSICTVHDDFLLITTQTADIKIEEILSIGGEALSIPQLVNQMKLDKGYILRPIDAKKLEDINQLNNDICRYESFWVKRLKRMKALGIGSINSRNSINFHNSDNLNTISKKRYLYPGEPSGGHQKLFPCDLIIGTYIICLSLVTGIDSYDIGYTDSILQEKLNQVGNLFADYVPLHAEVPVNSSFEAICMQLNREREKIRKHITYINDIWQRYPELSLRSEQFPPLGISVLKSMNDLDLSKIKVKQLHLVISEKNNEYLILWNGEFIEEHVVFHLMDEMTLLLKDFIQSPIKIMNRLKIRTFDIKGRIDQPVILKGVETDIGLIEEILNENEDINDAAVVFRKDSNGKKCLCAFIDFGKDITRKQLKSYILGKYIIPVQEIFFIQLEKIPRFENGEINRELLEKVELNFVLVSEDQNTAPRNKIELEMAQVWQQVLGKDMINIYDNFFQLGGDSIKAIQITARMKNLGYKFEIRALFENPTIAELSSIIDTGFEIADQSVSGGIVPFTPIQKWFFSFDACHRNHFNQAVMLFFKDSVIYKESDHINHKTIQNNKSFCGGSGGGFFKKRVAPATQKGQCNLLKAEDSKSEFYMGTNIGSNIEKPSLYFLEELFKEIFLKIIDHHDALRIIYKEENGRVLQIQQGMEAVDHAFFQVFDLRNCSKVEQKLVEKVNEIQASILLDQCPLLKVGLFQMDDGIRILIVVHHLLVDGVSWRVLLEDFGTLYQQQMDESKLELPLKSDSFKKWSEKMIEYAKNDAFRKEKDYWSAIESQALQIPDLKRDHLSEIDTIIESDKLSVELSEEETHDLLTKVNTPFTTQVNEILLTALGMALNVTFANNKLLIALEGHGRESEIFKDHIDVSRTVGWFTSIYPVILNISRNEDLSQQIIKVKEVIRQIPNKGIGYGIFKYLSSKQNDFNLNPQVVFNYLGQFENEKGQQGWQIANESTGNSIHPDMQRQFELEVSGIILKKRLTLSIVYSKNKYSLHRIKTLLNHFKQSLLDIISYCCEKCEKELTPSDLTFNKISIEELNQLKKQYQIEDIYPLSPMQQGMFYHYLYNKTSSVYFEQISYRLLADLNIEYVQESLNLLLNRHDTLRASFAQSLDGKHLQIIQKNKTFKLFYKDISKRIDGDIFIEKIKDKNKELTYDLSKDSLIRVTIYKLKENEYEFIWNFHHIIMDGWCLGILFSEFIEIYNSFLQRRPYQLPVPQQYKIYLKWLDSKGKADSQTFWRNYLEDYNKAVELPKLLDNSNKNKSAPHEQIEFVLKNEEANGLKQIAERCHVTLNTIFQVLWGVLLGKYNNTQDVVFGIVVSGRTSEIPGIESIVGLFINTVPLRIQSNNETNFSQLLRVVQKKAVDSEIYHYFPLADIQSESHLKHNLLNHILIFENYPVQQQMNQVLEKDGNYHLEFKISNMKSYEQTNYDFNIVVVPGHQLSIIFDYNKRVYDGRLIKRIKGQFNYLIKQVLANDDIFIKDLTLNSPADKEELLFTFNDTVSDYPKHQTIHKLFEIQQKKSPDTIALKFQEESLAYQELQVLSNQMSAALKDKGVKANNIVGIFCDFSLEIVIGLLGILKAGGAYLPIDADYPKEKILTLLKDSQANFLLTQNNQSHIYPEFDWQGEMIDISHPQTNLKDFSPDERKTGDEIKSTDLAYVMYTSGSTGHANGILVEHCNVVNLIDWFGDYYQMSRGKQVLLLTAYTFDPSVEATFGSITHGATLHMVEKINTVDRHFFCQYVDTNQIQMINFVPQLLEELLCHDLKLNSLEVVISGGEKLSESIKNKIIRKGYNLYNHYGPTEITVDTLNIKCSEEKITLGHPIFNMKCYVVDENDRLVPIGVNGELYIAGYGVTRGYLNNPELTNEKFTESLFIKGERIFRSGDVVRRLMDGQIEYLGRRDDQVKIRGVRIEPDEIKFQLMKHPSIRDAVINLFEEDGEKTLCAHYIRNIEKKIEFFPSIGEYPIYDDFLYYAMTHDELRNSKFRSAIKKTVANKVVVDIGTGQDFILARYCIESGAKKVYAIEISENSYWEANKKIKQLGLEKKIILIHGDASKVELPEKVDVCLSNIVGTIGSSEGAIPILNSAHRFLKEDGVMLPLKCLTKIAAVSLPNDLLQNPYFSDISAEYIEKLFSFFGYPFDFRLCLKNFNKKNIISNIKDFEELNFTKKINTRSIHDIKLTINENKRIDGFVLWLNLYLTNDLVIDNLENEYVWLPFFIPVFSPGIEVSKGDILELECLMMPGENNINPDYQISGTLIRNNLDEFVFDYQLPYIEKSFKNNFLYKKIFANQFLKGASINHDLDPEDLRDFLSQKFPHAMIPTYFKEINKIPLTANGKVDKKSLVFPGGVNHLIFRAPKTKAEKTLTKLWSEVLGIKQDQIGLDANFFNLGGHSLKATVLVAKIHKSMGVKIPLSAIFKYQTVGNLSNYILTLRLERYVEIQPVEKRDYYPLSSAQKRLYILHQMDQKNTAYNMPFYLNISKEVNLIQLEEVFLYLINRHESLRTSFHMVGDEPVQIIQKGVEFKIGNESAVDTAQDLSEPDRTECIKTIATLLEDFTGPFDLSLAPLLRVALVEAEINANTRILLLDMHHIITDGISQTILQKEFIDLYNKKSLTPLKLQYKDFSSWQLGKNEQCYLNEQENFWLSEFESDIPVISLPMDFSRPQLQSYSGNALEFNLSSQQTLALKSVALETNGTIYMVLLALINVLFAKLTNQEDIVVGSPIAGRRHSNLENIMGMFVNTLAIRQFPNGNKSMNYFLNEVINRCFSIFENQDYPFELLVEKLEIKRDVGRNPIFDVMFDWLEKNQSLFSMKSPFLRKEYTAIVDDNNGHRIEDQVAKFDLSITAKEQEDQILFSFNYCTSLFKRETIAKWMGYLKNVVAEFLRNRMQQICEVEILSSEEKQQLLFVFNQRDSKFPAPKTLNEIFTEKSNKLPHKLALIFNESHLTYSELNQRSEGLAEALREKGIQSEELVGIHLAPSMELVIGMISVLKSGGAYVPLDIHNPIERLNYMINDCNLKYLISDEDKENSLKFRGEVVSLHFSTLNKEVEGNQQSSDLAYVIYTSGSTGKPRGVLVQHQSIVNLIFSQQNQFKIGMDERILLFSPVSFDASVEQIFLALLSGVSLVIAQKDQILDDQVFTIFIQKFGITHFDTIPNFLKVLDIQKITGLKRIISGGEICSISLAKSWYKNCDFYNQYGPTEATVTSSRMLVDHFDLCWSQLPIGKPISNIKFYLCDSYMQLVPIGVIGELFIGGEGLARGYLNNPELTVIKFCLQRVRTFLKKGSDTSKNFLYERKFLEVQKPFYKKVSGPRREKYYKTGDLGRWLEDGNLEFLGRIDHQVKIRGFRIELGEIEKQLMKLSGIMDCTVIAREEKTGDKFLCAYIVSKEEINDSEMREFLSKILPDYMIPSYFVKLNHMPITDSGKVDRRALPKPMVNINMKVTPPRNEIESQLIKIWKDVLRRDASYASPLNVSHKTSHSSSSYETIEYSSPKIGIDCNFFELGGHSLKATILISRLHKELNVKIPLVEIFKTPTIRGLADFIRKSEKINYESITTTEMREYYPLSSAQKRLFILQQLDLSSTVYNMPAFFPISKDIKIEKLDKIFQGLINRHESLRTTFFMIDDTPVQMIQKEVAFRVDAQNDRQVNGEDNRESIFNLLNDFTRPFNLSEAPLLRVKLVDPGKKANWQFLFIDMHHIIADGTSHMILEKEFMALFEERSFIPLRLQYKDFSYWQNLPKQRAFLEFQEKFWLQQFSGDIPILNLNTDYPRPQIQDFKGNVVRFSLSQKNSQIMKGLVRQANVTLYMHILAIFTIFLSKLSDQEDIIVGTPIAARRHEDLEPIIGMFVNTLAMRNYPYSDLTFLQYLKKVKIQVLSAFENQEYPFEELVEKVSVHRDTSRNPLFDVMLNLSNLEQDNIPNNELFNDIQNRYELICDGSDNDELNYLFEYFQGTAKFDLNLGVFEKNAQLIFNLEYSTILFKRETIDRFIEYFCHTIEVINNNHNLKLADVDILPNPEKEQILEMCNGIHESFQSQQTLHGKFRDQVKIKPDHIAVVFNEDELTYRELDEYSNQMTLVLYESGVKPNDIVALMSERSIEMVVAILAILKAGAAYLPIDPELPEERIKYMLMDSDTEILVITSNLNRKIKIHEGFQSFNHLKTIFIDEIDFSFIPSYSLTSSPSYFFTLSHSSNLVYMIYTSGTTGYPKGVLIEHKNVINLIDFDQRFTNLDFSRILQFHTLSFDASAHEIFGALLSGGGLFLMEKEKQTQLFDLMQLIENTCIKTLFLPMSFLKVLFSDSEHISRIPDCVKHIQTAGEQVIVNEDMRDYLRKNKVFLHNHYGPSETHVVTTCTIDPGGEIPELPSIGKPILNTTVFILDRSLHVAPIGVTGELYIGGDQVGRGYLNNPALTADRFCLRRPGGSFCKNHPLDPHKNFLIKQKFLEVQKPFYKKVSGSRRGKYYKTGDLGRWLEKGNIEFLGRVDHQVKVRGFRVELAEVEVQLLKHPGIKECVVIAREEKNRDIYLSAFYVPVNTVDPSQLREFLSNKLPDYMIPSYFKQLDFIPVKSSGKLNKQALPVPGLNIDKEIVSPRNEIEKQLIKIWKEVLCRDALYASPSYSSQENISPEIGIDSNFFELGGHSLKAMVLISKLHRAFHVKVPLAEVFKVPTIRGLGNYIRSAIKTDYFSIHAIEKREFYELSSAQKRLCVIQQLDRESTAYNMPQVIPISNEIDIYQLKNSFRALYLHHEALRSSFHILDEKPVQRIQDDIKLEIEYFEGAGDKFKKDQILVPDFLKEFIRPFDLSKAPLFRVGLIKIEQECSLMMVDIHHIISDGISLDLLIKDFFALYMGEKLSPLYLHYKDFSHWQNQMFDSNIYQAQEKYWLDLYSEEIPQLNLPSDFERPEVFNYRGDSITVILDKSDSQRFKELASQYNGSLFMNFLAVLNVLFYKYTGQTDIVIGGGIAGRNHEDLQQMVGIFLNSLPLRNFPDPGKTYEGFLKEVVENSIKAFENQDVQFEKLVERLEIKRDPSRNPLFDVIILLQNYHDIKSNNAGIDYFTETEKKESIAFQNSESADLGKMAKLDLSFYIEELGDEITINVEYYQSLFRKETIQLMISHLKCLIKTVINDPQIKLLEIQFPDELVALERVDETELKDFVF